MTEYEMICQKGQRLLKNLNAKRRRQLKKGMPSTYDEEIALIKKNLAGYKESYKKLVEIAKKASLHRRER